jgi:integrase
VPSAELVDVDELRVDGQNPNRQSVRQFKALKEIVGSPKKTATILQFSKETGCRIGEACKVEWRDFNEQAMTVMINHPEKNSNPRILKISSKLVSMLDALPRKSERIFDKTTGETSQLCLARARQKMALKLQNPRLAKITHHTLRHWRATMTYTRLRTFYTCSRS